MQMSFKVTLLLKTALASKMQMSSRRAPKSKSSISILSLLKSTEAIMKKEIQVSPLDTEFLPDIGEIIKEYERVCICMQ